MGYPWRPRTSCHPSTLAAFLSYSFCHAPSSLVADAAPAALRGSAFGVFDLVTGLATLVGSLIARRLWAAIGPAASFLGGAAFTVIGLGGLVALTLRPPR